MTRKHFLFHIWLKVVTCHLLTRPFNFLKVPTQELGMVSSAQQRLLIASTVNKVLDLYRTVYSSISFSSINTRVFACLI